MHAEMLVLRFSEGVVDQPIIYRLVKDYDLEFNLLKATIYPGKRGSWSWSSGATQEFPAGPQIPPGGGRQGPEGGSGCAAQRRALLPVRRLHRGLSHRSALCQATGDGGAL